jgi:hypothetical protein
MSVGKLSRRMRARPWATTGATQSSSASDTRGSPATLRALTFRSLLPTHHVSVLWTNQTGVTCGSRPVSPCTATRSPPALVDRARRTGEHQSPADLSSAAGGCARIRAMSAAHDHQHSLTVTATATSDPPPQIVTGHRGNRYRSRPTVRGMPCNREFSRSKPTLRPR